ncbi:unnamed protein product [Rotaria sordida]|uniref:Uncharacterized protein n=1 Tax=Rotaria sordida TaxID=392033 RepID=A0A814IN62_9BILA|nr:unnamed protein product [Rotaria sordida]CAF3616270.1 unnamed protein product [Rotaria sordida]
MYVARTFVTVACIKAALAAVCALLGGLGRPGGYKTAAKILAIRVVRYLRHSDVQMISSSSIGESGEAGTIDQSNSIGESSGLEYSESTDIGISNKAGQDGSSTSTGSSHQHE